MCSAHLATAQADNLRAARQPFASGFEIAALGGIVQFAGDDAVHGSVSFGPTLKSVGPCQHELGIVKSKTFAQGDDRP